MSKKIVPIIVLIFCFCLIFLPGSHAELNVNRNHESSKTSGAQTNSFTNVLKDKRMSQNNDLSALLFTNVTRITDLNPGTGNGLTIESFVVTEDDIYFVGQATDGDVELYKQDLLTGTVTKLTNFSFSSTSTTVISFLTAFNKQVFFSAYSTAADGREPWRYDPATNTVTELMNINTAANSGSDPAFFTELGGKLYFIAAEGNNNTQLWVYNPANNTTTKLSNIIPGLPGSRPFAFNGKLYFGAYDEMGSIGGIPVVQNQELWEYNPSGNTFTKFEINPGSNSSSPDLYTILSGKLYFRADNGSGSKLMVFNPSTNTVSLAITSGTNPASPNFLTVLNNKIYFYGQDSTTVGREPWAFDPTSGTASLVSDINPGTSNSSMNNVKVFDNKLYFSATNGASNNGRELWVHDPSNNTTTLIDINTGTGDSTPSNLTVFNGKLYFTASTTANGSELRVLNAGSTTPSLVDDINAGAADGAGAFGGTISPFAASVAMFFRANDGTTGDEFWRTNLCPVSVTTSSLPNGSLGVSYNQSLAATGGTGPYTFAVTKASLPPGLTLSSAGVLSGTPTTLGTYNFNITGSDSNLCGGIRAYSMTINNAPPNTSPTITPVSGITRQAGSASANSTIANVLDAEDPEQNLTVTVNGGASATVNGVTVSNITVNSSGVVNADVVAACGATNATFTLRVTDSGSLFDQDPFTVTVTANTAPSVGNYSNTTVTTGSSGTVVTPDAAPTDNGSIASVTAAAPGFTGTFVGNTSTGAITINNANPGGTFTVTVTVTDNCGCPPV